MLLTHCSRLRAYELLTSCVLTGRQPVKTQLVNNSGGLFAGRNGMEGNFCETLLLA
ncbi:hypothetical protein [Ktedonobacter sp. SOSP1-52]|uniref:hypothetical protein n=1 Tax=Ktedonobacter sp. SOSP1-52 TaxID=2778366 RepID=UPI001914EF9C|nr:hypothetical protein [Ktedonobacter sp. SOSP1-52]